jgi:Acyl-coenzyme A:6-aminopenicillanic acid acyl-transferase
MAEHTEGPRVIRGKGSWLEIGRQYGEELRVEIAHARSAIEELAIAAGYDRVSLKDRVNAYTPYAQELPARWDELVGVAQGSCLAIEDILLMQMLEDLLDVDACTTAGRAGFLLHAEMWFASHTDYAVLICEPADGPPVITVSCVGFLTGVGLNGSGFAMGVQSTASRDARVGVPRAMVSRSALCAVSAAEAVREATRHHRSGGNGFVIVTPTGVQVVETSAAIDDVTEERPWAAHTNHYISDKFQKVADSEEESVQRLEEAVAMLGGVSDRELTERARLLVEGPGFVPRGPDHGVVTAFVMLADTEVGSVQTAPGGGARGPWVRVTLP